MKDRLNAIVKGEQDVIQDLQESQHKAVQELQNMEPEDYVITQYSLPKALTGVTRTTISTFGTTSAAQKSRSTS